MSIPSQFFYLLPTTVPKIIKFGGTNNITKRLQSYNTGYGQDRIPILTRQVFHFRDIEKQVKLYFTDYIPNKRRELIEWPYPLDELIICITSIIDKHNIEYYNSANPFPYIDVMRGFRNWVASTSPEGYPRDGGIISKAELCKLMKLCLDQPSNKYLGPFHNGLIDYFYSEGFYLFHHEHPTVENVYVYSIQEISSDIAREEIHH